MLDIFLCIFIKENYEIIRELSISVTKMLAIIANNTIVHCLKQVEQDEESYNDDNSNNMHSIEDSIDINILDNNEQNAIDINTSDNDDDNSITEDTLDNYEEDSIDGDIVDNDEDIYHDALEENEWNIEQNRQNVQERYVLYDGCELTLEESKLLILTFTLCYNISDKALESLVQLIDCHLPSTRHGSLYMFMKEVPKPPNVTIHFYCPLKTCKKLIQFVDTEIVTCECGMIQN